MDDGGSERYEIAEATIFLADNESTPALVQYKTGSEIVSNEVTGGGRVQVAESRTDFP